MRFKNPPQLHHFAATHDFGLISEMQRVALSPIAIVTVYVFERPYLDQRKRSR